MNRIPRSLVPLFLVICPIAAAAAESAALTRNDLRNSPERWPASVAVARDLQFRGGASVKKGQLVGVVELEGGELVVDGGHGLVFALPVGDTDFVARAGEAWLALSPEQRAITVPRLIDDRSLWPLRVRSSSEFQLRDGAVLPAGGEYELLAVTRDGVKLHAPEHRTTLSTKAQATDLVARARALVMMPAAQRPSRIAAALRGQLVDAAGRPVDPAGLEATQVFALYYGASWCAPCRQFSPDLVKFVNRVAPDNPRLTVVLMSNDKVDAEMLRYMRDEKMPWPALPLAALNATPLLTSYVKSGIPQLLIVDRHGAVLADSFRGSTYLGPRVALQQLERILGEGAAR